MPESSIPTMQVSLEINGRRYTADVEPRLLLAQFLRDTLHLTGTHVGCQTSQCGACTVLVNGQAIKSCTMLTVEADGGKVMTVEGLQQGSNLNPVQQGFWASHGLQCGFCTPGAEMIAYALLMENPDPTDTEIRDALDGLICRCTGYENIVRAVRYAAKSMADAEPAATRG